MATIGKVCDIAKEFEWRIEDFFSLLEKEEERRKSPLFSFAGESWHLKIYITKSDAEEETIGYIDVYLFRDQPGPPIRLRWSVGLKTVQGENDQERHFTNIFEKKSEGYGTSMFLKKTMLSELVPSHILTIVCKLEYSPSSNEEPRGFQKPRDEPKSKLESNGNSGVDINVKDEESQSHRNILANRNPFFNSVYKTKMKNMVETKDSGITTNVKEDEFQQHRDIPSENNPFYISMFSPQNEDILESEELYDKTTEMEDGEFQQYWINQADPNLFFNSMFSPTNEGTLESEKLSDKTTNVEDHKNTLHKNNQADPNPFFNSIFSPRMECTLENEELSNQTIKVEDEFKLHSNNQADPNPFFDSVFSPKAEWTLESEELSNKTTKVEDDEFRLHRNNQDDPNPFYDSMFSPRNEVALESEELSYQTTKVEDDEFRMHRNDQTDQNPFFNCIFKTESERRRKRSKANDQEFSNTDSIITNKAKDEEFRQCRNIPVGHNLSFNTIFEVLNNYLKEEEERERRIIGISINKSEDSTSSEDNTSSEDSTSGEDSTSSEGSTSSEDSISSKDSILSKASSTVFLTTDSEVSDVVNNNEEFRLPTSPTYHNVCTLYGMAKYRQDYQLKAECLRFMENMLSVDTFYDFIVLALNHDEKELLQNATEFFCRNTKEIIHRVKWQTFMREYPTQANQLYIRALHYNAK